MKKLRLFVLLLIASTTSTAIAQHSDIQFGANDGSVVILDGIEGFTDGFQIFEGNFPTFGFSERFSENPGFLSENGNMVGAGDEVELEVLHSDTFGSYLTFYDEVAQAFVPTDATITIEDNMGTNTSDLVVGNLALSGENPQFLQTADGLGEVHAHIDFLLSEEAEVNNFGAYGILFKLVTDNPELEDSTPVWLVFNYGMNPSDFDNFAIPAFVGDDILLGDVNGDGEVNLLDVGPFVNAITSGVFVPEADINGDGIVNLLDVAPFIELLTG